MKIQRDVFGRLLYMAVKTNIDVEKALTYPLAPMPFSLCRSTGEICKTQKSVIIETLIAHQYKIYDIPTADVHIIDGFYLLHTLKNLPEKYESISRHILQILVNKGKEVHIIFDRYRKPSIKDYERCLRGEKNEFYDIRGSNRRSQDFRKLLKSPQFKEKFVQFLIEDWNNDKYSLMCDRKIVKLNFDKCYVYEGTYRYIFQLSNE